MSEYGSDDLPPEAHAAPAVLVGFVDLGIQESKFGPSRQAVLTFELLEEKTSDGKAVLARKQFFNLSVKSKPFREALRALTGLHNVNNIETRELLGRECCLAIEHSVRDSGTYADIEVKELRGNPSGRRPETPMTFFSMHPSDFEERALGNLPKWQQDKITKSPTFAQVKADLKQLKDNYGRSASEIVGDKDPFNDPFPLGLQ